MTNPVWLSQLDDCRANLQQGLWRMGPLRIPEITSDTLGSRALEVQCVGFRGLYLQKMAEREYDLHNYVCTHLKIRLVLFVLPSNETSTVYLQRLQVLFH